MNIGFYLHSLQDQHQLNCLHNYLNSINTNSMTDINIFYNNIGQVPFKMNCGFFNSTDLWNFRGNLIVTSLECLITANKIVNNLNTYFYYGWDKNKYGVLEMLRAINDNTKLICKNDNDAKYLRRTLGRQDIKISHDFNNIIEFI